MAESVVNETVANLSATVNETAKNVTGRAAATPEGMLMAYSSLVLMALLPIFFGSFRSVKYLIEQKKSGEKPESMTSKDAAMFPIIASCTLLGLYIFFKIFSKEYINLLLTLYFFGLGILAVTHLLRPNVELVLPASFPNKNYTLDLIEGKGEKKSELVHYEFDRIDLLCLGISAVLGVWYLLKKHWIANNIFGLAFSLNGVELLHLNTVTTGCILLGGLFVYDIFWVFGTDVMVTVAKSFEAPIKLIFPMDLLEKGLSASNFAMLGLGDIVIPGIFIALLLRFDHSKKDKTSRVYFYSGFVAYFLGLVLTVLVMHTFKAAQPALLYLVPACLGTPIMLALLRGEISDLFKYEDNPEKDTKEEDKASQGESSEEVNGETKKIL
ncbi:minor histocompatibility antigen H13-like isoform X2 [Pocillopora damicornis]|uniref:minor histocompatibility antigen H13-like isoform X2 n=1 Tax=Pocillopora damicornis TaxID=46731 RepID=UPI000F5508D0|nr:minor histocompatibility antigen H13-like isoform X2 [Pocillopora damicornis]